MIEHDGKDVIERKLNIEERALQYAEEEVDKARSDAKNNAAFNLSRIAKRLDDMGLVPRRKVLDPKLPGIVELSLIVIGDDLENGVTEYLTIEGLLFEATIHSYLGESVVLLTDQITDPARFEEAVKNSFSAMRRLINGVRPQTAGEFPLSENFA